jgi:hypothetical protein
MKNSFVPASVLAPSALLLSLLATPAAAQSIAWYCPNPAGFYPAVAHCYVPLQQINVAPMPQPQPVMNMPIAMMPGGAVPQVPASQLMPPQAPMPRQIAFNMSADNLRDQDDRRLNYFAYEFSQIDFSSADAAPRLQELESRVDAYRQALITRRYNAADIMQGTLDLQHRMLEKEALFTAPQSLLPPAPPPATQPAPAALTVPPPVVEQPPSAMPASTLPPESGVLVPPPIAPMESIGPMQGSSDPDEAPAPQAAPVPPVTTPSAPNLLLAPDSESTPL